MAGAALGVAAGVWPGEGLAPAGLSCSNPKGIRRVSEGYPKGFAMRPIVIPGRLGRS